MTCLQERPFYYNVQLILYIMVKWIFLTVKELNIGEICDLGGTFVLLKFNKGIMA